MTGGGNSPMVRVEWTDSMIVGSGAWVDVDDPDIDYSADAMRHYTVGFLVNESASVLVVASNLNETETRMAGVMIIPKQCVYLRALLSAVDD